MMDKQKWIQVVNVSKKIKGKYVLNGINVAFDRNKIYGIIGANGSGKTMLLRTIAGFLHLSTGSVIYQGGKPTMGVIIENPGFLLNYTGFENLKFLAEIQNKISKQEICDIMIKVGLDPNDRRTVKAYSLGMKQKLALTQAVMEHPDILILDEPFRGLDEKSLQNAKNILIDYYMHGGTIIIASHNYEEISVLCHKIYKMDDGELVETNLE